MKEMNVVWVPTVSTVGNLRGKGRFDETAVVAILESALENLEKFSQMGGLMAVGSDAGAWAVEHGCESEWALLRTVVPEEVLEAGNRAIREKF